MKNKTQNQANSIDCSPERPRLMYWGRVALWLIRNTAIAAVAVILVAPRPMALAEGLMGKEAEVIRLTNEVRAKQGVATLVVNDKLNASALAKAMDMANQGYFGHADSAGHKMAYWISGTGYNYLRAGENLAKGFVSPASVVAAWTNSPTHYTNLINANYEEIGVGIVQGVIDGRTAVFVVQHFGEPFPQLTAWSTAMAESVYRTPGVLGEAMNIAIPDAGQNLAKDSVVKEKSATVIAGEPNDSIIVNTSPVGLALVAYNHTQILASTPLRSFSPAALAAGMGQPVGVPDRGYQIIQTLFMVLVFAGFWNWWRMFIAPAYAWLKKQHNRTT
ncbi:MAG: CAP domain-containing protein [Patescibacteria group bacterium]